MKSQPPGLHSHPCHNSEHLNVAKNNEAVAVRSSAWKMAEPVAVAHEKVWFDGTVRTRQSKTP